MPAYSGADTSGIKAPPDTKVTIDPLSGAKLYECSARGKRMAKWHEKEPVVVSGLSGRYPESNSVDELAENLFNHVDMVTMDDRRWPVGFLGSPRRSAKIKDLASFDNEFFQIPDWDADWMDPQVRLVIECVWEALWDAGYNPSDLKKKRTGTYIGFCFNEAEVARAEDAAKIIEFKDHVTSRLPFTFGYNGPVCTTDTACASSFCTFHEAVTGLRMGLCEQAIVVGMHVSIRFITAYNFFKLNMTSVDGCSKCFDASANGYARAEAVCVAFLQKKPDAHRVYAQVVHTKTNCDGWKEQGITYPSTTWQANLMAETYAEAQISPLDVKYIEAHCTGTAAGDPAEMAAICRALCNGREGSLLVGAVKSNLGHSEGSSGMCSISKVIIAFENKMIPANINFTSPNPAIEGLMKGWIKPVIENTPFEGGIVGLNCFGFGGVNVHIIVRNGDKEFTPESYQIADDTLPRLVVMCGRTPDSINHLFNKIMDTPKRKTRDFLALVDIASRHPINQTRPMNSRGYLIIKKSGDEYVEAQRAAVEPLEEQRPLWYVFSGMGSQWPGMGKPLLDLPLTAATLQKCAKILKEAVDYDLIQVLTTKDKKVVESPLNSFVAVAAIQIALVDLLAELGLSPDGIVGHSIGELACGYADGCLSAKETLLAAYWRGKTIEDAKLPKCTMAAVGLTWEEAVSRCPQGVVAACHNSDDSVTVSGEYDAVMKFVESLQDSNVFAREVNSSGVAFHGPYMAQVADKMKQNLSNVITSRIQRTQKWISTSVAASEEDKDEAKYSCVDYYVNNLVKPVLFKDALAKVPKNAAIVELAPHALLQAILKRGIGNEISYIGLTKRNATNLDTLLVGIGQIYSSGHLPQISKLYPKFEFPVSRGTPQLASIVQGMWKHDKPKLVPLYPDYFNPINTTEMKIRFDVMDKNDEYLAGHVLDGRCLFPATGYLLIAWQMLAKELQKNWDEFGVQFKDVVLHRATMMPKSGPVMFIIKIVKSTGEFSIEESGTTAATGFIQLIESDPKVLEYDYLVDDMAKKARGVLKLKQRDVYKALRVRGYDYGPSFQSIRTCTSDGRSAKIKYQGQWISFVDSMLQLAIMTKQNRFLYIPTRIEEFRCLPTLFYEHVKSFMPDPHPEILVGCDPYTNIVATTGIEMKGLKASLLTRKVNVLPTLEVYEFVPDKEQLAVNTQFHNRQLNYVSMCSAVAQPNVQISDEIVQDYITNHPNDTQLLQMLYDIRTNQSGNKKDIVDRNLANLSNDLLSRAFENERFLRPMIDLAIENLNPLKFRIVEVNPSGAILCPSIQEILNISTMNVQVEYALVHPTPSKVPSEITSGAEISEWLMNTSKLPPVLTNYDLIVYKDVSTEITTKVEGYSIGTMAESMYATAKEGGFVIALFKEKLTPPEQLIYSVAERPEPNPEIAQFISKMQSFGFQLVNDKSDGLTCRALLFRKLPKKEIREEEKKEQSTQARTITIADSKYNDWVEELKAALKANVENASQEPVWLIANDTAVNGIVGMVNCLRREPGGDLVRCLFDCDGNAVDINDASFAEIKRKSLVMNIKKEGQWGSYRHYTLPESFDAETKETEHAMLNVATRGDLSSFKWFQAEHQYWPLSRENDRQFLLNVYYATLNFKDVMTATGKLVLDALPGNQAAQDCIMGIEVAGRTDDGRRLMGMVEFKGLATTVQINEPQFMYEIPDSWSMEDAATVVTVYSTCYYALIIRGKLRPGEKVLIHSGSGGVGQAAISICLSMGCEVYTTVGNQKKKEFLLRNFPKLTDKNIASSRDTSFERQVLRQTKGHGVDLVLNSLAEEKLIASVRCLAENGRFLEIGKFDMAQNNKMELTDLFRNKSFHGIHVDSLAPGVEWTDVSEAQKTQINVLMTEGIKSGVVRPLPRTVFKHDHVEEAFRFMASGKHMGKVVLKIREEEKDRVIKPKPMRVKAIPRTEFNPTRSYIITGGLGGFGLEVAKWMRDRGAKKIVLTSRSGPREPYHHYVLKDLRDSGIQVHVSTSDSTTEEGCEKLIQEAQALGPIDGIFNLAMVLRDAFMENQDAQKFEEVCKPKVRGTQIMDTVLRRLKIDPTYFVCFSSVSCGRGNAGQANYGYANSVMERICEKRRREGLSGLAIQWGAIGDVGVVAEQMGGNDVVIGGSLPQRMVSCLQVLDRFLQSPYSICSSVVKADKKVEAAGKKGSIMKVVGHIMGLKDTTSLSDEITLGELGLDSLQGVELKQALERDYETVMSFQDIRKLTVAQLKQIGAGARMANEEGGAKNAEVASELKDMMLPSLDMPTDPLISLNPYSEGKPVFFLPPIDGSFDLLKPIAHLINQPVVGLNWIDSYSDLATCEELAETLFEHIKEVLIRRDQLEFHLVGYSFGANTAFDIALLMNQRAQELGPTKFPYRVGKLILLDGSPAHFASAVEEVRKRIQVASISEQQAEVLITFMSLFNIKGLEHDKLKAELVAIKNERARIRKAATLFLEMGGPKKTIAQIEAAMDSYVAKFRMINFYKLTSKYNGDVLLLRAKETAFKSIVTEEAKVSEDYGLNEIIEGKVKIQQYDGNHVSFVAKNQNTLAQAINEYISS